MNRDDIFSLINKGIEPEEMHKLVELPSDTLHLHIASHSKAPKLVLHKLANSPNYEVRNRVALNSNTHPKTLHKIATQDPNWETRNVVAFNPSAHPDTLHHIATSEYTTPYTRRYLASNPNTSNGTLHHLAKSKDLRVCKALVERKDLPAKTLHRLALRGTGAYGDSTPNIIDHANVHPKTLHALAKKTNYVLLKRAIVDHPKVWPKTIEHIYHNSSSDAKSSILNDLLQGE